MKIKQFFLNLKAYLKAKPIFFVVPLPLLYFTLFLTRGVSDDLAVTDNNPVNDSIKIIHVIATGDAMSHMPLVQSSQDSVSGRFNFYPSFEYLAPILNNEDLKIVNFETTLAGPPYSGYPQFCAPDTLAYTLKNIGFNFFVNANNHSVDKSSKGINRTIDVFNKYGIQHTGTFRNEAERKKDYPAFVTLNGIKVSILNYTYGTNSLIAPKPTIINYIDTNSIKADLAAARNGNPDMILVCLHWGNEYQREPCIEQKMIADVLFRNGTDVIVGSHPHVIQPIEVKNFKYKGRNKKGLVIWSLGNFFANQRKQYRDGGMFVKFDIAKNIYTGECTLLNIGYIPFWVYKTLNPVKFYVLPIYRFENDSLTFKMNVQDKQDFHTFITDTRKHLSRDTANIKEFFPEK